MTISTYDTYKSLLDSGECKITFTKTDGSERIMKCTRKATLIPEEHTAKSDGIKHNEDVIRVFDTENQGWRSFRVDSVKSFEFALATCPFTMESLIED